MSCVLVIGGYGTFGRRLVRMLSDLEGLRVFVAGRDPVKAEALIAELSGPATLVPFRIDRARPLAPQLSEPVQIVVDAVGPFQAYGASRDIVLDYCLSVGATYIDLSDDPAFCAHMVERAAGAPITIATGWSTFSAVTGAIVHALGGGVPRAGIAPNPYQPMGRAVIQSVLSYAGRPIGREGRGPAGLTRTLRRTIVPPGTVPLRNLLFSNVATPDSVLIHPDATGWTAPQPEILHRMLIFMAKMVRLKLLPPLTLFGTPIHYVQSRIRTGESRGGLFVDIEDVEGKCTRCFHLVGEEDAGPDVPAIPAAALIEALHNGEDFAPGLLRPGADFPLHRLTPWFDRLGLAYGVREETGSLYSRVLGGAMANLPEPIQDLHEGGTFEGQADVFRGRNPLARLVADLFGMPKAGPHTVRVSITPDDRGVERWSRTYSGREMLSFQSEGQNRSDGTVVERFGPFSVQLGLGVDQGRLVYKTRGWSFLGLPLPRILLPGGDVFEAVDEKGRFCFDVDIVVPGLGRLVHYRGWLERIEPS